MSEWQPIETAPQGNPDAERNFQKAGPRILATNGRSIWIMRREYTFKRGAPKWELDDGRAPMSIATHWMPLPPLPDQGDAP